ncbi:MAG TPA: glycosyltransferase family 4 protein [Thermoflexia bacterium]|nr:glycosyltransferase family 4 protein [Thermoflexia bacterium]
MRIGQLTDCYKPVINGVTHFVSLHKRVLESWGHEVYVFTLGNVDYPDDEPRVIRSPAVPLSDTGYHLSFRYSRHARQLAATMDVLHIHHPFLAGRQAVQIVQETGIPLVFTNHTRYHLQARYYLPFIPDELSDGFLKAYLSRFTALCDLIVVPARGVADWLREIGVEAPIEVIPNGVDVERIAHPPAPLSKADVGLPEEAVVAIWVGRIGPEKNLEFLLRAFNRAAAEVPSLYLLIVGDGPKRDDLEEFAHWAGLDGRVRMVGAVPYEEVPNWLAMADFFAITSTAESHPLSLLEALAAGLPALGIAALGVEDSVIDGENGLLCPEDVDAFAQRMVRLATDGDLRARLSAGARQSRHRFDIRNTSAQLLAHYERLVEGHRRRRNG